MHCFLRILFIFKPSHFLHQSQFDDWIEIHKIKRFLIMENLRQFPHLLLKEVLKAPLESALRVFDWIVPSWIRIEFLLIALVNMGPHHLKA